MTNTTRPSLSIILPYYNGHRFLTETLRSIEIQSVFVNSGKVEIIVINDGSSETSLLKLQKIIQDFSHLPITLISLNKRGGAGHARDLGIKHAQNQYLTFIDVDDMLCGQFSLEYRLNFLESHSDYAGIAGCVVEIDENSQVLNRPRKSAPLFQEAAANITHPELVLKYYCRNILENSTISASTLFFLAGSSMFRTEDVKQFSFDPKYEKEEDVEWLLRFLQLKKVKLELVPFHLRRIHQQQYHLSVTSPLLSELKGLSQNLLVKL